MEETYVGQWDLDESVRGRIKGYSNMVILEGRYPVEWGLTEGKGRFGEHFKLFHMIYLLSDQWLASFFFVVFFFVVFFMWRARPHGHEVPVATPQLCCGSAEGFTKPFAELSTCLGHRLCLNHLCNHSPWNLTRFSIDVSCRNRSKQVISTQENTFTLGFC